MPKTAAPPTLKTLLKSEVHFRQLTGQRGDAIQLYDEDFNVVYTSAPAQKITGFTPEELSGRNPFERIHPDDIAACQRTIHQLIVRPDEPVTQEYRIRHKDGHYVWVETIGINHLHTPGIKSLVANIRDITERKEMEQALLASEERLRFMAEAMPQKIFTVDKDGHMQYFNPQWSEYTGLPPKDIQSKTFIHFVHPDDTAGNLKTWRKAIKNGEPFTYEHRFRRADGTYRWHLTNAQPMSSDDGTITMWIGSSTDIHDVKKAEKRQAVLEHRAKSLQQQRQQLLELHKAKDEFISLASHQLRTPATGVKQYLGMILEGILDKAAIPPDVMKIIEVAYESNERQLKIVNDLLKVAYVDAGHVKLVKGDCDVDELLHGVKDDLREVFENRSQKVVYTNKATGITVQADCRLIRMVLENLVDNASKYSPVGTTVTISVQRAAGFLCINVTDQGVGISREDQVQLFKKFSRIENPLSAHVGGTGLGLYWAHQIISLHRGSIMVRSTPGKGSTFSVQLPLG